MAWHHVISTNCAFQFRLFLTFLFFVLLLVAICSYPGQVTTWQPGILCGWSGHLEQCTTEHSFGTYIINFQKTCSRHIFSRVLTSLANCLAKYNNNIDIYSPEWPDTRKGNCPSKLAPSEYRAANIVRHPCSDSSHVTAP